MRRTTITEAKAHLSRVVDDVERHGRSVIILRRGKPAAAIVPLGLAPEESSTTARRKPLTRKEVDALFGRLGRGKGGSAVADLISGRR